MHRQHSVITRRQALACGLGHDAIHRQIRPGGRWQSLLPGGTDTREASEAEHRFRGHTPDHDAAGECLLCRAYPVALPARAVADAVRGIRDLRTARAVIAVAVQTRRCTIEQLQAELKNGPVRWSALFRAALAEVAQGTRSAPEAELLDLIKRNTVPPIRTLPAA
jgi:hypothetical protein